MPMASQDPGPVVPPGASSPASTEDPLPLKAPSPDSKDSQPCGASTPRQEVLWSQSADGLFWEDGDVAQATDSFSAQRRLCQGTFADIYWGQRHGTALAFKRLREVPGAGASAAARFLEAEVQVCRRCCHPNILPLLGFCPGERFCTLVYPLMANGSLHDRLQCRAGSAPLPWPQRVSICSGLLRAVGHLHSLGITHGNIRSSNVLLDGALTPKLAHPAKQLCPVHERSGYTLMKTRLFQASAAYLPESALRVGRPTERTDIFSCGIVLAEVFTGMPAMDESRSPVYLKDLLLSDIPSSSSSLCSERKTDAEKVLAQELCLRHLDSRAGQLPEDDVLGLALAACLCLQRRNPSLAEVSDLVANLEMRLRGQEVSKPEGGRSLDTSSSSNTPEETDDVEVLPLGAASARLAPSAGVAPTEGRLQACGPVGADSSEALVSPNCAQEATSWKIEINEAKRKLMEDIVLYKEDKLDSSELFGF